MEWFFGAIMILLGVAFISYPRRGPLRPYRRKHSLSPLQLPPVNREPTGELDMSPLWRRREKNEHDQA